MLGNPNTGSVVPVTSENYFAPPTSAEVPLGVAPFVPASTATNQVSLSHHTTGSVVAGYQAPVIPSQQHMGVTLVVIIFQVTTIILIVIYGDQLLLPL